MNKKKVGFNKKDIEHIARNYKIPVSSIEKKQLVFLLSRAVNFLDSFNKLRKRIKKFEPTHHVAGIKNRFKHDKPEDFLSQKEALSGAVETYQGYFKIPIVIKKENEKK